MIIYRLVVIWAFLDTSLSSALPSLGIDNVMKKEKRMCNAKSFITFIIICALLLVIMTFL